MKYKYSINNLDCANCARKIEESLNKNKDFQNVKVNFNTCKLSYESEKNFTIKELNELIKKVEPDAYITKEEEQTKKQFHLSILIIGVIIGFTAYFINIPNTLKIILYIISYTLLLYKVTSDAIKQLIKGNGVNENALISISCIGALLLGEVLEGIMVIALYTVGKILEEKAVNNSRSSIKNLLNIKEPYANKKEGNKVKVEELKQGDIIIIKKGEKVPVDGIIIKGNTKLDMQALTGESELVKIKENENILSGSINMENVIEVKVTNEFKDCTVSKILELLENATDKKTQTETMVSKISKVYTPIIIILAISIIILLPLFGITLEESIYRALTFLVISCPCAIAISVPLSYFTAIGVSSKKGILIKGSNYLDNLSNAQNIIFDKTGTITNGTFQVTDIKIEDENYTKEEVINILVKGESLSNHPIAKSITKLKENISSEDVFNFEEIEGKGVKFTLNNHQISIGNSKLCNCNYDTLIHLNIDGKHVASIKIDDGIKPKAKETIDFLKKQNIKTYMFTGDKKEVALNIGKKIGIDEIAYEMLPTNKYENYEKVSQNNKTTIFVGDGINDAPVLKRADIGISMGAIGTDSAINASDIVLMKDDLDKIPLAYNISKYTKKIIKQNLIFAISVKIIILLLSLFGLASMWLAVFADTGVTLLTILNTLRIIKKFS